MRITEPLPNCFSICDNAAVSAFFLFSSISCRPKKPLELNDHYYSIERLWGIACKTGY